MHIGDNLSRLRKNMEMNQAELAEASGVSRGQISRIESGDQRNPQLQTVVALATSLGVSLEEIVFGEQGPNEINYLIKAVGDMDEDEKAFATRLLKTCLISAQAKKLDTH